MNAWVSISLDVIMIGLLLAGLMQAIRLSRHLSTLRASRLEMERFVQEFNSTVLRAEAGIKGLKQAARDSGDDLEKLVEKATMLRDELQFIVESADQIASRLSQTATSAVRPTVVQKAEGGTSGMAEMKTEASTKPGLHAVPKGPEPKSGAPSSKAEKELLQALQKLS